MQLHRTEEVQFVVSLRRVSRAVIALVLAAFATGACSHGARRGGAPTGALLRLGSMPGAFGLNGSRLAWVGDRVVVADLESGKRVVLGRGGTEGE